MKKLQHTPGPWWNSGLEIGTAPMMDIKTAKADGMNYNNAIANARLIAAAPEMLEALIMVKKYGHSGYVEGSKSDIEFWFKIDRTIEKATGLTIEEANA